MRSPGRSTSTPIRSCRPSTATGCRWCCSTAGSTPTSPSTSTDCAATCGADRPRPVRATPRPPDTWCPPQQESFGPVSALRPRQRLCSCVHKRLPWRARTFPPVPVPVFRCSRCPPLPAGGGPGMRSRCGVLVIQPRPRTIPEATVARLAVYLRVLTTLADGGRVTVASGELAGRRREPGRAAQGPVPPRPLRRARRRLRGRHPPRPDRPRPRRRALPPLRAGRHRQPRARRWPTTPGSAPADSNSSASSTPPPRGSGSRSAG